MTPIETALIIVVPMLVIGYALLFMIVSTQHKAIMGLKKEMDSKPIMEPFMMIQYVQLTMEAAVRREDYEEA
jgi:hypothetical protein